VKTKYTTVALFFLALELMSTCCQSREPTQALFPILVEGKWGAIDSQGSVVISPRFVHLRDFNGVYAVVALTNAPNDFGLIDHSGKVVLPFEYRLIDRPYEGLARVHRETAKGYKWGYVSKDGAVKIPAVYDRAGVFSEGFAAVGVGKNYHYIDGDGENAFPDQRFDFASEFHEGLAAVRVGREWFYINREGRSSVAGPFRAAGRFSCGLAPVQNAEEKWAYVAADGDYVTDFQYTFARSFRNGLGVVCVGNRWGAVDTSGHTVVAISLDEVGVPGEGLLPGAVGGKWGYFGADGSVVIPPRFERAWYLRDGLACVEEGGKKGFIARSGEYVVVPQFDNCISYFREGIAQVEIGTGATRRIAYVNMQGEWVFLVSRQVFQKLGGISRGEAPDPPALTLRIARKKDGRKGRDIAVGLECDCRIGAHHKKLSGVHRNPSDARWRRQSGSHRG